MNRRTAFFSLLLLVLIAIVVRVIELGGASFVSLKSAPALSGAISQSLIVSDPTHKRAYAPIIGRDYQIKSSRYFDGQEWAIVSVTVRKNPGGAIIILRRASRIYKVVLGPGTAFTTTSTQSLPPDVTRALKDSGAVIYTPIGGQR